MRALPSLRQLRYLIALAEHLHFTKAAESCFVTQSTLSAGIKELEELLGPALVERDRHSVQFTEAGSLVVARARELIAATEDLVEEARVLAAPMQGILRLGAIPTIAPFLLPPLLTELRSAEPDLKFALREDMTANLLDRLRSGHLDLALIALPVDVSGLQVKPLFEDELWLVGPMQDPALKARHEIRPNDWSDRLLLLEEGHCLREHALAACAARDKLRADEIAATSLFTLLQMVESGLGLALIPELAIRAGILTGNTLRARALPQAPTREIALVSRKTNPRATEAALIADFLMRWRKRQKALPRKRTMHSVAAD
ncbi:LysR family transcriptional regulator [Ahniella affigens]|uniref:LysR family transcriptional regulator n=1 Tax=Ahniella affigens TaxID=2021234 RepID=A0A2P1PR94_9GAMM|nr:hydrogen peroxide-inducible genes activator [Ahniella affigens]AVP97354.1 LysR family transcriptional regulator [Ahniella affigens]